MDKNELHQHQSKNSWQNIGISYQFAEENVPVNLRLVFMALVRRSFGYNQRATLRTTQKEIAEAIGISERKLRDDIKALTELKLLEVQTQNLYKKGGGSDPCSYSPVFPTGYGQLHFKEDKFKEPTTVVLDNKKPKPVDNIY